MSTWEYRVEELSEIQAANQLNFIGKEGWELIYVHFQESPVRTYRCFFKRKVESSLF